MFELNQIINNDCIRLMAMMPYASVDLILCDLPYGVTANHWDSVIDLKQLWKGYRRIIKPNGVIILTAIQPFTSMLVASNPRFFRHELIWRKDRGTSYLVSKVMPLRFHENILIFAPSTAKYNPQMEQGEPYKGKKGTDSRNYAGKVIAQSQDNNGTRYPKSVLDFKRDLLRLHPTQKPVDLFEYLIRTYSNEGETVLDNCMGSGTTAIAAIKSNRQWLGFELDEYFCNLATDRIEYFLKTGEDYRPDQIIRLEDGRVEIKI